ncbi:MAG: hypothetical protein AB8E82_00895 [Aureispira sp.]
MNLPNYLFWDIDLNTLDWDKNARFIIQRVIQRGSLNEWKIIKQYYGLEFIKHEILLIRNLDKKTLNFFSTYFDIAKTNFKCFTIQQSTPKHFNY